MFYECNIHDLVANNIKYGNNLNDVGFVLKTLNQVLTLSIKRTFKNSENVKGFPSELFEIKVY